MFLYSNLLFLSESFWIFSTIPTSKLNFVLFKLISLARNMSASTSKKSKEKEQQEIVATFQKLREEQKVVASKSAELQIEQKSHE